MSTTIIKSPAQEARERSGQTKLRTTRDNFIAAAAAEFYASGYVNATARSIAARANRGESTFYRVFERKSHVGVLVIDSIFEAAAQGSIDRTDQNRTLLTGTIGRLQDVFRFFTGVEQSVAEELAATESTIHDILPVAARTFDAALRTEVAAATVRSDLDIVKSTDTIVLLQSALSRIALLSEQQSTDLMRTYLDSLSVQKTTTLISA